MDIPGDLTVLGDPELLARAVGNVLRNAIRYGGTGLIKIAARREDDESAILTVRDEGPGVPPESLLRLFDAFYRPDPSRCRETGGSGLGLAIVKSCLEATGGSVTARNLPEGGFEVTMRFQAG